MRNTRSRADTWSCKLQPLMLLHRGKPHGSTAHSGLTPSCAALPCTHLLLDGTNNAEAKFTRPRGNDVIIIVRHVIFVTEKVISKIITAYAATVAIRPPAPLTDVANHIIQTISVRLLFCDFMCHIITVFSI